MRQNTKAFTGHERDFNIATAIQNTDYLHSMHARYYSAAWGDCCRLIRVHQICGGQLSNPVTGEQGKGKPILHRGGGFGQIRKEQRMSEGSAGGEFGVARAGGRTPKGVDIIAPVGTPLVASFSGKAYDIRENDKKLGLSVFVRGKGGIIAIYSHLDSVSIKEDDTVTEGQNIGEAGRSGNVMVEQPASEDHVHFQLYGENGKVTDPEAFLNDPKKQEKYRDPNKEVDKVNPK